MCEGFDSYEPGDETSRKMFAETGRIYQCKCGRRFSYGTFEYFGSLPVTHLTSCSKCEED